MMEFIGMCFATQNVLYTILLICVLLYWCIYITGAFGSEALDLHLDGGADVGADADVDVGGVDLDADAGGELHVDGDLHADGLDADASADGAHVVAHEGGDALISTLRFVWAGEVPVTLIFTILIFMMWASSMMAHSILGSHYTLWMSLSLILPNFVLGLILTRLALWPFVPLLRNVFQSDSDEKPVIGHSCRVVSMSVTEAHGQCEVDYEDQSIVLQVRSASGETLRKGDLALISHYNKEKDAYIVTKIE
ncbi:hypothetical protein JXA32_10865 [Candidatus Sumerlaeota bacterium]|nr:hypothetical protein [Candidatus Sumerlaeota bacterium]